MADGKVTIDTRLDIAGLKQDINKLPQTINKMKVPLRRITALVAGAFSAKKLIDFGKEALNVASDLTEVQNVVDVAFGSMSYKMEQFASTSIETYGISKLTAKNIASTYTSMARGMGQSLDEATDKALEMTGRMADIASFYNLSIDRVNTIGRAVYSGETEPLKQIGVIMTEAQLQTFALAKGYKTLYKNMSAAQKLEVRQLYFLEQTNLAAGDFVRTQDSWANQTRMLSERWKELAGTLGSTVIPYLSNTIKFLNATIGKLQIFANTINKVWGKTSSKDTADNISNIQGATDSLTNSIKAQSKASDELLGDYDNLQVISKDTGIDTDTSGIENYENSLGNVANVTDVINNSISQTSTKLEEFLNLLKDGDFKAVGSTIGKNIREQLDSIDWDYIYEGAADFGKNLADYFNGLFDDGTFSSLSSTIAGFLNTAVEFAVSFLTNFNFSNYGRQIAQAINTFFKKFNFKRLTQGINAFLNGMVDMTISLLTNIDFGAIVSAIGDILLNLDWGTVLRIIGLLLTGNAIIQQIKISLSTLFTRIAMNASFNASMGSIIAPTGTAIAGGLTSGLSAGLMGAAGIGAVIIGGLTFAIKEVEKEEQYWADRREWLAEILLPNEEWQARIDEFNEMTQTLVDDTTSRLQSLDNINIDYNVIKNMSDRYFDLAEKQSKSNDELNEMQTLKQTLIKEYPDFEKILDDENTSYQDQKQSIDNLIESMQKKAEQKAIEEMLVQVYKDQMTAEQNLEDATNKYNEAYQEYLDKRDIYLAKKQEYDEAQESIMDGNFDELESFARLSEEVDAAKEDYANAGGAVRGMRTEMEDAQQALDDIGDEITTYSKKYVDTINTNLEKGKQTSDSFWNFGKNIVQGLINGMNDNTLLGKLRNTATTITDIIKNTLKGNMRMHSPSKLTYDYGEYIDMGLNNGMLSKIPTIKKTTTKLTDTISGILNPKYADGSILPTSMTIDTTSKESTLNTNILALIKQLSSMNNNDIVIQIDGKNVFTAVRNQNNIYKKKTGSTAF